MRASAYALVVLWSGVLCATSFAQGVCPVSSYDSQTQVLTPSVPIPDNDPSGILVSDIQFPPQSGMIITDVVVELEIEHTWVGDLTVRLQHTSSSGTVKSVDLIAKPLNGTCSANFIRSRPSKRKGLVTTATVKMSISLATSAITGAAPVPVPPPMPAVINTMSAPFSAS